MFVPRCAPDKSNSRPPSPSNTNHAALLIGLGNLMSLIEATNNPYIDYISDPQTYAK